MSYRATAHIIAGYKVDKASWTEAWNRFDNSDLSSDDESLFIVANVDTENGDLFCGIEIQSTNEYSYAIDIEKVLTNKAQIEKIQDVFDICFRPYYEAHPEIPMPKFTKYLYVDMQ